MILEKKFIFFSSDDLNSENVEDFKLGNTQDVTYNYANRKKKNKYDFEPVILTRFLFKGSYWLFQFNGYYKTDRIYNRGGTIESGSDAASKLTKNETVSEIFKLGLGIFGILFCVKSSGCIIPSSTKILYELHKTREPVLITEHGKPSAYLVDASDFEMMP